MHVTHAMTCSVNTFLIRCYLCRCLKGAITTNVLHVVQCVVDGILRLHHFVVNLILTKPTPCRCGLRRCPPSNSFVLWDSEVCHQQRLGAKLF